jgi:crotonobetainyl-CoA:carnitine CoA-transferase CaiB-like acyl-CoA transferase
MTRVLAAYGAHVLRIDPPGFEEVGALLCETTAGKRRAFLDLHDPGDLAIFERLLAEAHVVVHGYRSDALERLGLGAARRREMAPGLVDASLDAYGWTGAWAGRRGFDSLVQMSAGIAERGATPGKDIARPAAPAPLPAQALDHGTGYLLAAAVCRALVRAIVERRASDVRLSLARTARLLADLCRDGDPAAREPDAAEVDRAREPATSAFGAVRRVRCPGTVDGFEPRWDVDAGALGAHPAAWW